MVGVGIINDIALGAALLHHLSLLGCISTVHLAGYRGRCGHHSGLQWSGKELYDTHIQTIERLSCTVAGRGGDWTEGL